MIYYPLRNFYFLFIIEIMEFNPFSDREKSTRESIPKTMSDQLDELFEELELMNAKSDELLLEVLHENEAYIRDRLKKAEDEYESLLRRYEVLHLALGDPRGYSVETAKKHERQLKRIEEILQEKEVEIDNLREEISRLSGNKKDTDALPHD